MTIEERMDLVGIDYENNEIIKFTETYFDDAVVGITTDDRLVYDFDLLVKALMETDNMSQEEAIEYLDYNTIRACNYMKDSPVVIYPIPFD